MIRVDASATSVVAVCTLCPWRTLKADRLSARTAAADHDRQHGNEQAANALAKARQRARLNGG